MTGVISALVRASSAQVAAPHGRAGRLPGGA